MKKLFLTITLLIAFGCSISAQEISPNAIGIRTGDNDGFGVEISYQKKMGDVNRFEADLGFRNNKDFDAWKLTGVFQWIWNIDGQFNWYAGFGAGLGSWESRTNKDIFLNAVGNVVIEYDFADIPLLVSLDFRPELGLVNSYGNDDLGLDIALSLRYQF